MATEKHPVNCGETVEVKPKEEVTDKKNPPSMRGRFRLTPSDRRALDRIAVALKLSTWAGVVRRSLEVASHLAHLGRDTAVVLRNDRQREQDELYLGPSGPDAVNTVDVVSSTDIWEVRWDDHDRKRLETLVANGFGANWTQVVRRGVHLLDRLVARYQEGWRCGRLLPAGHFVPEHFADLEAADTRVRTVENATTEGEEARQEVVTDKSLADDTWWLPSKAGPLVESALETCLATSEKLCEVVVTVIGRNNGFPWYVDFTQDLKRDLSYLGEFSSDNSAEAITEPYLRDALRMCIRSGRPFLHLVPFYQTRARQAEGFNILPYGFHARIGALIHRTHPIWAKYSLDPDHLAGDTLERSFFRSLVRFAWRSEARIVFLQGTIFQDFVPDVAADLAEQGWCSEDDAMRCLGRYWLGIERDELQNGYLAIPALDRCRGKWRDFGPRDVVLYDHKAPLDERIAGWHDAGYVDVALRHGLPILAGIGMSQSMNFHLKQNDRDKHILNSILPTIRKFRHQLEDLGVDLADAYLGRVAEECRDIEERESLFGWENIKVMSMES